MEAYRKALKNHEDLSNGVKKCELGRACTVVRQTQTLICSLLAVRFDLKDLEKNYNKTEDDIKALQSVGQIIGEVLKQLDEERCE